VGLLDSNGSSVFSTKPENIGRGRGKTALVLVPGGSSKEIKSIQFNYPDPDWDAVIVHDPDFDPNVSKTQTIRVLYFKYKKGSSPSPLAGGAFTTPIGFTVVLTRP